MVEPATGVSGALGALQGVRPPTGGGDSGSLSGAATELSAAARGLQTAQGQIAGQTMAINQMTIAGQAQTQQLSMMINQLNMSVGQLIGAINTLAGAQRASAIAPAMPAFAPMASTVGAVGSGASDAMAQAARMGGGMFSAGARGVGNLAGAMAAPFMPGTYMPAQPGQLVGSIGNAGMARGMMMGAGIVDLPRAQQQRSNAAEVQRLAGERGAFKMGEIMLGAGSGIANQATSMVGGAVGGSLGAWAGAALGTAILPGVGTAAGAFLGRMAGSVIGSDLLPRISPVNQTMDQIGAIRGGGEMYARNAFRFNAAGGGDRPSFRERGAFGRSMLQDATSDLSFNANDMQQMFGGAIENDLMRGVGGSQQARQRMRQLKESVKIIGQTLGTTIQESMQVMGDLQAVGIGPQNATRALAGANISGLTRQEALQGQMSFMNRYAGTGMQGQGLMNLAAQSQQVGQVAMRQGLLSAEQIAGAGGRAGVNQVYGQGVMALAQGGLGTLNMAARMGTGSFGGVSGNPLMAMMQAGGAATTQNLVGFAANRGENMRNMLNDPAAQARMLQQVGSIADQFKGMGNRDDIVKLILKQQGVEDPGVFMNLMKSQPQALREQLRQQQRALAELQVSQATENFSITGRIGRAAQSVTLPVAGGISNYVAGVQDTANNMLTDLRNEVLGIKSVSTGAGDINVQNLRKLRPTMSRERQDVVNARPNEKQMTRARAMARTAASRISEMGLGGKVREMREETDPQRRRALAQGLLGKLSGGDAYRSKDPAMQKAYEQAISEQFGIDISSALNSAPGGLSDKERAAMDSAMTDVRKMLGGEEGEGLFATGGALAGAVAGSMILPGVGTAIGAVAGGAAGFFGAKGRGVSQEQVQRLAQSDSVKKYLAAAQGEDTVALNEARGAMLEELGDDTLGNLIIDASMGKDKAKALSERLSAYGENAGKEGMSIALKRGGDVLASSLREAGGIGGRFGAAGNVASALAGGTQEGIQAALRQLRGMDASERTELLAKAGVSGDILDRAMRVKEGMTLDQLTSMGIDEKIASNVLGGSSKLTAETAAELQTMLVGQAGVGGEGTISGVRGGFTQAQTQEQVKLAELIARTSETLLVVEQGLRESGFKVTARAKP